MRKKTKTKEESRHGKHRDDLVGFAGYITPELKAVAQIAANELETTMMDLVRDGFAYFATKAGVIKNGEVKPEYKDAVAELVRIYNQAKQSRNAAKGENAQ